MQVLVVLVKFWREHFWEPCDDDGKACGTCGSFPRFFATAEEEQTTLASGTTLRKYNLYIYICIFVEHESEFHSHSSLQTR
jgi:hypothetical protein